MTYFRYIPERKIENDMEQLTMLNKVLKILAQYKKTKVHPFNLVTNAHYTHGSDYGDYVVVSIMADGFLYLARTFSVTELQSTAIGMKEFLFLELDQMVEEIEKEV